ncbi:hypothetical protein WME97_38725 [Sorangium sp. So ce367]|uniref:hypothetical protein n=1 Tax=Sorangium sp. So ce367 TaxID=3133305 RepID=UPI003F5EFD7C
MHATVVIFPGSSADAEMIHTLRDVLQVRIALQYCDREGLVGDDANPNGSAMDIAGIYGGPRRNVLGLMPPPERMSEPFQGHGSAGGRALFDAVLRSVGGARSAPSASAP